ncbi:inactive pancreatic lipase-related protein 1-like [Phymastichus coffea]|uniref:inactive pancreatic lipase-related protein 1-like n=1 Tax=Phymastichus coffea TaxID=108790 RepID=UPI00273C10CA|nr:inactive pancreatic lipase-related protein 1-like [Phymastichus coffea]
MACCYNIEASKEMKISKVLCSGLTEGMNFLYCLSNYPFSSNCYKNELSIYFYAYVNNSEGKYTEPKEVEINLKNEVNFDSEKRTTIIIPGYLNVRTTSWISSMVKELHKFQNQDTNVIVVQWFKNIIYSTAAKAVDEVANKTANMLRTIFKKNGKPKFLHIIGHSLGAHIAGLTALKLKDTWFVDRVTGLDPARPILNNEKNATYKLNKDCANFVDVIHSNSDEHESTFGFYEPMGHIDFYPNGGDHQPSCINKPREKIIYDDDLIDCFKSATTFDYEYKLILNFIHRISNGSNMICDHQMSARYFIESFHKNKRYFATKIENFKQLSEIAKKELSCHDQNNCKANETCAEMGIHAENYSKYRQGIYLLKTNCSSDNPKPFTLLSQWFNIYKN